MFMLNCYVFVELEVKNLIDETTVLRYVYTPSQNPTKEEMKGDNIIIPYITFYWYYYIFIL